MKISTGCSAFVGEARVVHSTDLNDWRVHGLTLATRLAWRLWACKN
jgi:beta-xylosidase